MERAAGLAAECDKQETSLLSAGVCEANCKRRAGPNDASHKAIDFIATIFVLDGETEANAPLKRDAVSDHAAYQRR